MKKLLCLAALCASLTATPAMAATKADAMKWEAAYEVLNVVDAAETIYCLNKVKGCEETNPLFGKHPKAWQVIGAKVAIGGLHFVLVDRLANKDPKTALRVAQVSVVLQGTVVGLNARIVF